MTVIEIRRYRNGWKVCEATGVEPVFLEQDQAINYASNRASFRDGLPLRRKSPAGIPCPFLQRKIAICPLKPACGQLGQTQESA
jgi:hypothetical protein